MKKIKIIQISSNSPSMFLDIGKKDLRDLIINEWSALVAKHIKKDSPDFEVECWGQEITEKKKKEFLDEGVKFRIFPSTLSIRPGMDISLVAVKELEQEIIQNKDKEFIIHFHEYHTWQTYLFLRMLRKYPQVKIVAQHHGGRSPLENLKRYWRLILVFPILAYTQYLEKSLFRRINLFYYLSDEEKSFLERTAIGSKKKFQTMGIERKYFLLESQKEARKRLGLELNKKYGLFIGRITKNKGVMDLIQGVRGLQNTDIILIGGGDELEEYKKYVNRKNIENVLFKGPIYTDKKMDFLSACDFLILPSYNEGAPVVIMEALARNLPVIATKVGGIPWMINEKNGILINSKSSAEIRNAVQQISGVKKTGIKKTAEKYSWGRIILNTIKDYQSL